ncbi:bacteriophage T4 gp5 trimerisation domain-containing protein [Psychrobacter celer]|uniref:bacteriophage T4 gp5 trimerisation domain-containing protein n=1 Tax=Psychrobacter celer TaxID=306572 RepID=UPI003FD28101
MKSKSFNSPLENYNELMFNDDAGFELVNLQAQRDLNSLVKNDETRRVNRDRTTIIDKDETVTVHGFRKEVVDKDEHITIHQNRTEIVDKDETITIHQNRKERVDDNETIDIGGNRTETVHKSEQITIKGNRDKTVNGNDTLTVNKDRKETVNKSRSLTVDRTNTEFVKLGKSVTVGLGYATQVGTVMNTAVGIMQTEQIGRIKKSFVGKSYSITAGDEFKITVGKSSLVMNADGSIIITGSSIVTQAEKENKVIGKDVLINPPGASAGGGEYEPSTSVSAPVPSSQATNPNGLPSALAALKQGPLDRAGSFGRVDDTEADGSLIAGNTHSNEPNQGGGGLAGFGNYNPSPYDKPPEGYKYVWDGRINDMVLKPIPDNKSNFAVDPLAFVFPNTMGNFTNDPQVKSQTRLQSDLRKVSNTATTIAGYGPYIAMGGKEAVSLLPQASINGASSGGALGGLSYIGTTPSEEWDPGKAFIYTAGGALTGGFSNVAPGILATGAFGTAGTYATQYAAEGEASLLTAGVNGFTGGTLKPYNLGIAGDIAQTVTTSAADEFGKDIKSTKNDKVNSKDLGLFWLE